MKPDPNSDATHIKSIADNTNHKYVPVLQQVKLNQASCYWKQLSTQVLS